ncbi:MAG: hypothetical protein ACRD0B_01020 [Acidimicrobiales bacterium]
MALRLRGIEAGLVDGGFRVRHFQVRTAVMRADQDQCGEEPECRDRREHGQAEGSADLLGGVDEAARNSLLGPLDPGDSGDGRGYEAESEADRRQQRGTEDVGQEAPPVAIRLKYTSPPAVNSIPAVRIGLTPNRVTRSGRSIGGRCNSSWLSSLSWG